MGTKFEKDPLAVEQDNHATKVVNSYIVYDLDAWPSNTLKNFKLKNYLFHEINTAKTATTTTTTTTKWVYSGYGIAKSK